MTGGCHGGQVKGGDFIFVPLVPVPLHPFPHTVFKPDREWGGVGEQVRPDGRLLCWSGEERGVGLVVPLVAAPLYLLRLQAGQGREKGDKLIKWRCVGWFSCSVRCCWGFTFPFF